MWHWRQNSIIGANIDIQNNCVRLLLFRSYSKYAKIQNVKGYPMVSPRVGPILKF